MTTRADVVAYYLDRIRSALDDGVTVLEVFDGSTAKAMNRTQTYFADMTGAAEFPLAGSSAANITYLVDAVGLELHIVAADDHEDSDAEGLRRRCAQILRTTLGAVHGRYPDPDDERIREFEGIAIPGEIRGPDIFPRKGGGVVAIGRYQFTQNVRYAFTTEEIAHG